MNYMALKSWESKWKIQCNLMIRKIWWFFSQFWFMLINPCSIICYLSTRITMSFFYLITNFDTYFWAWIYRSLLFWNTWLELHIIGLDPSDYMPTNRKSGEYPQIRLLLKHGVKIVLNRLLFIKKFRVSRVTGTTLFFVLALYGHFHLHLIFP